MYCQSCGNQINEELSFCNRCGNRVVGRNELAVRDDGTASVLKSLSIATGVSAVVGLGGLIGLITILIANHVEAPGVIFLAFLFAATVFGICFLMTRQISRLTANAIPATKQSFKQTRQPEQLNPTDAATEFQSTQKPFRSVTENTTRTLDKTEL